MSGYYQPTNREKARQPKGGRTWCPNCDRCLVGNGRKCPVCGVRKLPFRGKPSDAITTDSAVGDET